MYKRARTSPTKSIGDFKRTFRPRVFHLSLAVLSLELSRVSNHRAFWIRSRWPTCRTALCFRRSGFATCRSGTQASRCRHRFSTLGVSGYIGSLITTKIALGTASIAYFSVIPLAPRKRPQRALISGSGGRLLWECLLAIVPLEFPAFSVNQKQRGETFSENLNVDTPSHRTPLRAHSLVSHGE